jgi:hypothetical protein
MAWGLLGMVNVYGPAPTPTPLPANFFTEQSLMQNFLSQNPAWTQAQVTATAQQEGLIVALWLQRRWLLNFFENEFGLSESELWAEFIANNPPIFHTQAMFTNKLRSKYLGINWKNSTIHSVIAGNQGGMSNLSLMNFLQFPPNWHSGCQQLALNPQTYSVYMDENCQFVSVGWNPCTGAATTLPNGKVLCGFAGVSFSPIALILEGDSKLNSDMRVVQFSLDPHLPHRYSLWRGSNAAPLLVYDPQRSGIVSSAKQLFGDWTFGGPGTGQRASWANGYQALGSLDRDGSGVIEGSELQNLALWYDSNRNAVSEPGEVKPALGEGITALYYKDPSSIPGSKDLKLDIGFKRNVNGTVVSGATIDWYGETFESQQEAAMALTAIFKTSTEQQTSTARSELSTPASDISNVILPQNHPLAFSPSSDKGSASNLSGYWIWTIDGRYGDEHPGFFALEQGDDGTLSGYSVVEAVLAQNDLKLRSMVKILRLRGGVIPKRNKDGQLVARFTVTDNPSEGEANTEITLSKDGGTLSGRTTQTVRGGESRSVKIEYSFKAIRIKS